MVILTLCGSERVLVVSTEPLDDPGGGGVGTRPWWLALLACGGAYWPLATSAMTSGHPHYCGHPHCRVRSSVDIWKVELGDAPEKVAPSHNNVAHVYPSTGLYRPPMVQGSMSALGSGCAFNACCPSCRGTALAQCDL